MTFEQLVTRIRWMLMVGDSNMTIIDELTDEGHDIQLICFALAGARVLEAG